MNTVLNASSSAAPPPRAGAETCVQTWRRETALLLGVSEAAAQDFGDTGVIEVAGKPVTLHPLHNQAFGPWLATARVSRPHTVGEADWCHALLHANTQTLLLTHAAFGLADEGDAILAMRIPPEHDHPRLHATDLDGLLALCNAMSDGALSHAGFATHRAAPPPETHSTQPPLNDNPELEASDDIARLIRGAALHLGASPEQAAESARTGSLELGGQHIGLVCDPDDDALIAAVDLGTGFLDSMERCRIALAASLELILQAGAAVGGTPQRCQLTARCALQRQSADSLAGWLHGLAALAAAMRAQQRTAAATTGPTPSQR